MQLSVSPSEVTEVYERLSPIGRLGSDPSAGYLRAPYSPEETAAMKLIESLGVAAGASSRFDGVGNLVLEWPGEDDKFVEAASHIDTVLQGGNYDGAAGVVAGLLALRTIARSGTKLKRGRRLRVWRAEESASFNVLYAGSRGALGLLDKSALAAKFRGQTLEEAMRSQGADPELIIRRERTISQTELDSIAAHLELHIEQGIALEVNGIDIGIVTSIRAPKRYRVILRGSFDHSGATPMGKEYRRDVNLAMAYIEVELDKLCTEFRGTGFDLVQTVGVINSSADFNQANPLVLRNAIPVISGFGYFTLDIRSGCKQNLEEYTAAAERLISRVAADFGVQAEINLLSSGTPLESLDPHIQEVMSRSASELKISAQRMPSGAGHDAGILGGQKQSDGKQVPVGMLFIPCREGRSHCPEEFASAEAIAKGASVLAQGLFKLAGE